MSELLTPDWANLPVVGSPCVWCDGWGFHWPQGSADGAIDGGPSAGSYDWCSQCEGTGRARAHTWKGDAGELVLSRRYCTTCGAIEPDNGPCSKLAGAQP